MEYIATRRGERTAAIVGSDKKKKKKLIPKVRGGGKRKETHAKLTILRHKKKENAARGPTCPNGARGELKGGGKKDKGENQGETHQSPQ